MCLAGENGAGKSTLIKAISGVFHYDEGDIYLSWQARCLRQAAGSPQDSAVLPRAQLNAWRARHVESL
jgi:ABC-type sugar transport system ATPase subunit